MRWPDNLGPDLLRRCLHDVGPFLKKSPEHLQNGGARVFDIESTPSHIGHVSAKEHFAETQNSECGPLLRLDALNFCCPEVEKLCRATETAHHQFEQIFDAVTAPVSGDFCGCLLQGQAVLLLLDPLASAAFIASVTFAALCNAEVGSPGSSPEFADGK